MACGVIPAVTYEMHCCNASAWHVILYDMGEVPVGRCSFDREPCLVSCKQAGLGELREEAEIRG